MIESFSLWLNKDVTISNPFGWDRSESSEVEITFDDVKDFLSEFFKANPKINKVDFVNELVNAI